MQADRLSSYSIPRHVKIQKLKSKFKKWLPILTLFTGVALLGAVQESRNGGDVAWAADATVGLTSAKQSHLPVLLSFHTPECGWCAKMDVETFTDPQVLALTKDFLCVRVDGENDTALTQKYHVSEFPTTILLRPDGTTLTALTGYQSPDDLLPVLRAALNAK